MPRYRKLHVKVTESMDLQDMPDDFTRLFWVLLPLGLCREGRGIHNAAWIKSRIFPLRVDVTPEQITEAMSWFVGRGMLQTYEVEGRPYFCIPNDKWHLYQGTTTRETESLYPPPPADPDRAQEPVQSYSRVTQELVVSNSCSDAICNMQYAEVDTEVDAKAEPAPTPPVNGQSCVSLYQQITGQEVPNDEARRLILDTVGTQGDMLLWERVIRGCLQVGYRQSNVACMCDHYARGEIPGQKARAPPRRRDKHRVPIPVVNT